ncbi:MAG: MBL fold metallo-hydrolase RNA specificity domain-containing protein, partial [Ignavibacteriaceae bacterium]|nr:MBL fold metallo-hydrolase RNA specificity domain-containing protein [Ignavibacteriaceae bacterium]
DRNENQNDRNENQNDRNENQNERNENQNERNESQNERNEGQNERNEGQNDRNENQNERNEGQNDRNENQNDRNESQNDRNESQNDRNENQNDRNESQNDRNENQNDRNEGQNDRNEGQNDRNERKTIRLGFSGDVGRPEMPILRDPIPLPNLDALIIESTYGNRFHPANDHVQEETLSVINKVIKRGGKIIIPAFAVGRTQLLVYELHELFDQKKLPVFPIFVDSPLAVNVTEVYRLHPECFDRETYNEFLNNHEDPFGFSRLTYTRDVNESKKLNTFKGPCMIISASGMAEGGRILHHLANNIEDANNLILFAGYAAKETLARKIMDGAESINIFGDPYTVRAEIKKMDYFSAHADQPGLLKYIDASKPATLNNIFIVHGEPEESLPLQEKIKGKGYKNVHYPKTGEEFEI